ncbi:MAG: 4-(cytidine 5'-diphospho)-2-C-methyl-D-erythritol kinase [Xanthomonadales bacterium]|nr:4-(cytidine 5'-diphospho)-2-C-methyl-D-erythritol kinase [Xanthomonadales bacterium]NIX13999.1 4-(cytidine 5'-diphospho)-2-C-methyl-D-erythritol kinase [Xanthomonadales bacterium]
MAERQTWPAPAKLNLFLRVTGRREDGYHELQTLFQLLDWGDELSIEIQPGGAIARSFGNAAIPEDEDLSVRAARRLQEASGSRMGARIGVRKHIPLGAGLGGGSSDAATVLLVLNELWDCGFRREELARIGLGLGADVPVFVHGRSAWGDGIGERLQAVELGRRHYVLVFPEQAVSTREVFSDPALRRDASRQDPGAPGALDAIGNDFEEVVFRRYPELARLACELSAFGRPRLTGTGSCLFLESESAEAAAGVTSRLKSRYNVRAVRGADRSPLLELLPQGT